MCLVIQSKKGRFGVWKFIVLILTDRKMQILKDYHLYEDLSRLNNDQYFHNKFQTPQLSYALTSPSNHSQYLQQSRNIRIYCYNLKHTTDKNVFIVIKWLIIAHRIIKNIQYYRARRDIEESLAAIQEAKIKSKYDSYLFQKLVKPYRHYLQKLCMLLDSNSNTPNLLNKKTNAQVEQEWYLKYNLVKYALYQFCPVLIEFMGFFKTSYPFLTQLSIELGTDIQRFMKDLKNVFKMYDINLIEKNDLQGFQESFSRMHEFLPSSNQLLFFTESEFCNGKVKTLFQSGSKVQGTVLF